VTQPPNVTKL